MTELKDLMRDMATRARTYDVTEKAIKVSRRKRVVARTVTTAIVAITATLVALTFRVLPTATWPLPWNVPGPVACDLTQLRPPGDWAQSYARLSSPNGRFVGGHVAALGGPETPVIWDNGVPLMLPMSTHSFFFDRLADNGDAIANYLDKPDDLARKSLIWRNGQITVLKGHNTYAGAFNGSGTVVGLVDEKGAIWRDPSREPEFLQVPDTALTARPQSVDDTGLVMGILPPNGPMRPKAELAAWLPSGELRVFAHPPELGEQWFLSPIGFDNGVVLFQANKSEELVTTETKAGRWDPRTNHYQLTALSYGAGQAATDNGWDLSSEGDQYFVKGDRSRVKLTQPPDTGGAAGNYAMTSDGRTVVASLHLREQGHVTAVVWHCR